MRDEQEESRTTAASNVRVAATSSSCRQNRRTPDFVLQIRMDRQDGIHKCSNRGCAAPAPPPWRVCRPRLAAVRFPWIWCADAVRPGRPP